MSEENTPDKKLKKLIGSEDISDAIEKLERKKKSMEDDFKNQMEGLFENLNPITVLDKTLRNVEESSPSASSLFKEAIAFGAGYLSKRNLIHQFKRALIKTFSNYLNRYNVNLKSGSNKQEIMNNNDHSTINKKENVYMNSQIEKVKAKPEVLPEPTYWPFFLALGIVFLGWGLLTTWLISLAGFIIMITSLTGWINILRHE